MGRSPMISESQEKRTVCEAVFVVLLTLFVFDPCMIYKGKIKVLDLKGKISVLAFQAVAELIWFWF